MTTLLIVLIMSLNMWMVIYLTRERGPGNETGKGCGKEDGKKSAPCDIMGRSWFRMPETKPQAATPAPNAATEMPSEEVDEKDVTFGDEPDDAGIHIPETNPPLQVPDGELDDVFTDRRVSGIAEYDGNEDYDEKPYMAGGFTFEDIDLAVRTAKKPQATGEERRHAGKVFCDMKGNELFALIEQSSEATRRKLGELMDFHLDSVTAVQAVPLRSTARKEIPAVPDNFEDFNVRDYV
ncbi:MAG: conjugal transfer protein TraD [Paraprevotella sp.]|nr:conjugal transfer protein TraD [Paraprevotella sp.]